jgi:hypothetical protein
MKVTKVGKKELITMEIERKDEASDAEKTDNEKAGRHRKILYLKIL